MAKKKKATTAKRRNAYFPCRLVQHDDSWSIILSEFHYFDDYFDGKDVEGYTIERLGKKLLRDHKIQGIKFDSEASMFCAYATDPAPLLALCKLFAAITGDEKTHQTPKPPQPKMSHSGRSCC
ncbi:MAG: hypothetical protein R3C53_07155 [Pirellulaceae bacterium]